MKCIQLLLAATSVVPSFAEEPPEEHTKQQPRHLRRKLPQRELVDNPNSHYCGVDWGEAHANCNVPCPSTKDEECGPGLTCFGYVGCTPPPPQQQVEEQEPSPSPHVDQPSLMATYNEAPSNSTKVFSEILQQPVPTYINTLAVRPSEPSTPAPFALPIFEPNSLPNPNNNYCGYGWDAAMEECYYACPSGQDSECPGGRSCHKWLTCTQAKTNPALTNVCGTSWQDAETSCATRCFLGDDTTCPEGETCFGGVAACEGKLPELTAVDVGLENRTYTVAELEELLEQELLKEEGEKAMADPMNWWCGTSWSNMLENCEKRCETDADCAPNSWTEGFCYRTTGGPENCQTPGVAVKEALPPGSRWCGTSWNKMLQTCAAMCESDEDCDKAGLGQCFEAPGTCLYVGVPVQEVAPEGTLWCGSDFNDAKASCHKECASGSDDDCPSGMSCFSESLCTQEGVPVPVEEIAAEAGFYCGKGWEDAHSCAIKCESDEDCTDGTNCYWVECENTSAVTEGDGVDEDTTAESTNCSPEVFLCPDGQYVGRSSQLDCDFYPCPGSNDPESEPEPSEESTPSSLDSDVSSQESATSSEQPAQSSEEPLAASSEVASSDTGSAVSDSSTTSAEESTSVSETGTINDFYDGLTTGSESGSGSGWGTTPLSHSCQSGDGNCGMCEGDCNSDEDCQDGLLCFSRGQGELTAVPGCVSGGDGDKPGMDYCYMEAPPATTTSITTTTTTTTTVTTSTLTSTLEPVPVEPKETLNEWVDVIVDDGSPGVELYYIRECSNDAPCDECEGDCDIDSHCMGGLKCFSRSDGSVESVPGCIGLGTSGMDYCYDPDSPIIQPFTAAIDAPAPSPQTSGCSAEVRTCPGGRVIRRDPGNNCEFPPCEESEIFSGALSPSESAYCGFSLDQVNDDCHNSKPCPSGDNGECNGMEICIQNTNCGLSTTTSSTVAATSAESCDDLCLDILPSQWCPEEPNLPSCLEVTIGELCEGDGECGTDDKLDNCSGTFDIYSRVECTESKMSQGQIMRDTEAPTTSPLAPLTMSPTTNEQTMSSPTAQPTYHQPEAASTVTGFAAGDAGMVVNNTTLSSSQSYSESTIMGQSYVNATQTALPAVESYEQSAAADFTQTVGPGGSLNYDRSPQQNTEATAPSTSSTSDASMYWTSPSTEYKWDLKMRNSQQLFGPRFSLLLGLASCMVIAMDLT